MSHATQCHKSGVSASTAALPAAEAQFLPHQCFLAMNIVFLLLLTTQSTFLATYNYPVFHQILSDSSWSRFAMCFTTFINTVSYSHIAPWHAAQYPWRSLNLSWPLKLRPFLPVQNGYLKSAAGKYQFQLGGNACALRSHDKSDRWPTFWAKL